MKEELNDVLDLLLLPLELPFQLLKNLQEKAPELRRPPLPHELLELLQNPGSGNQAAKAAKNSSQLERILGSHIGWRYLPPEVTDADEVLRFEIEELRNEHILMEAQERFGVCPDVDWDRWGEIDEADQVFILDRCLDSLLGKIRDRFGLDAEAIWVTSTRKEAAWYASGKAQPEEFERYCIPENAAVISDMGSQGALLVASKRDWEGCSISV